MPAITASTKKYGTPMKKKPIADIVPMIKPSSIWPPSQALIFTATSSLTSRHARALAP